MKSQNGFTLIELFITILVAGILMTIAAPSFTSMIKDNRLLSQQGSFVAGLNLARSEAVKRAYNIVLCRSADGASCAGSGGWEQGWIIYADADSDNTLDGGETILKIQGALGGGNTLTPDGTIGGIITYDSSGFITSGGNGELALCDDRGDSEGIAFEIGISGRVRTPEIGSAGVTVTCP